MKQNKQNKKKIKVEMKQPGGDRSF